MSLCSALTLVPSIVLLVLYSTVEGDERGTGAYVFIIAASEYWGTLLGSLCNSTFDLEMDLSNNL